MSDTLSATLLELLRSIFGSEQARNEFLADGEAYLAKHGYEDLSCVDFDDALAAFVETDVHSGDNNLGAHWTAPTHAGPGQHDSEAIVEKLTKIVHEGDTYITNNIDDRDVVNDSSFKGTLIADDVTFDNDIINASGDGAVAAGDDINGDVATGDNAFNEGSIVNGDQTATSGGAISNAGNNATAVGSQDNSDNSTTDNSDNSDNSTTDNSTSIDVDVELEDNSNSGNTTETETAVVGSITNDDGDVF